MAASLRFGHRMKAIRDSLRARIGGADRSYGEVLHSCCPCPYCTHALGLDSDQLLVRLAHNLGGFVCNLEHSAPAHDCSDRSFAHFQHWWDSVGSFDRRTDAAVLLQREDAVAVPDVHRRSSPSRQALPRHVGLLRCPSSASVEERLRCIVLIWLAHRTSPSVVLDTATADGTWAAYDCDIANTVVQRASEEEEVVVVTDSFYNLLFLVDFDQDSNS